MGEDPKPPRKRGKPQPSRPATSDAGGHTSCTPEVTRTIADAIRNGAPMKYAALSAGVTALTVREWQAKGEEGQEPYATFTAAVAHARAEGIVEALKGIKLGVLPSGMPDWKALREWLATVAPEEFTPTSTIEVKVRGEAIAHVLRLLRGGLDPETYGRCVDVLHSAGGGGGSEDASDAQH